MGASASASRRGLANSLFKPDREYKILVLGCMGSGKSTLCRHLVRIARGIPPILPYYQHTLQNNVLELYKAIAELADRMGIGVELYEAMTGLQQLIASPLYNEILNRNRRPELPPNHAFFVANAERILRRDYMPTESDLLYMYAMTVGLDQQTVRMHSAIFELYELPGHHVFRRKWTSFLNYTTTVIFCVDLSELCMGAFYSGHLKDKTLSIFKDLLNNELLRKSSFILLFNKKDLFDEWSPGYNFEQLAPQMRSGQEALSFYRNLFLHLSPVKKIYNHVVSLIKSTNLGGTVVDSLTTIIRSNKENVQPL
ncbi:unnamed protein product, partial [Mesorhabditis belari]|uniref:Uncharacterized protein n=1 Tax=Mesorhabditis belari TaxID=2138241 RepID=A0AAF3J9W7_9BILA